MGGPASTRWNSHQKAPLVEDSYAIDLAILRREGALDPRGPGTGWLTWTRPDGTLSGVLVWRLVRGPGSRDRRLHLAVGLIGAADKPFVADLELVPQECHFGGVRWFLRCPESDCDWRALKLYIDPDGERLACRECLGLTYRSVQTHDKRLDQALRDPRGFVESRFGLTSPRSSLTTARLASAARRKLGEPFPKRARGWGRKSMTAERRASAEIRRELGGR